MLEIGGKHWLEQCTIFGVNIILQTWLESGKGIVLKKYQL